MKKILLILFGMNALYQLPAQIHPDSLKAKFNTHQLRFIQEKPYISTNQPYYALGDTIWFQTFLVNAISHEPITFSNTLYVDLLDSDGNAKASRILKVENGVASGDFALSNEWGSGKYQLRAYTRWMLNFDEDYIYYKNLDIIDPSNTELGIESQNSSVKSDTGSKIIQISFFPEGGKLIKGIRTKVALEARLKNTNLPIETSGNIISPSGEKISSFQTDKSGRASFYLFNPEDNLQIILANPSGIDFEYENLEVLDEGFHIELSNRPNATVVMVKIATNIAQGLKGCSLMGQTRGQLFGQIYFTEDVSEKLITFNKSIIPSGVAQFSLLNADGQILAERLCFIDHGDQLRTAHVETNKHVYNKRENVKLAVSLSDTTMAIAAISVNHSKFLGSHPEDETLLSYLLLDSELSADIQNPGRFLNTSENSTLNELENLLIASSNRRFEWWRILTQENFEPTWRFEQGLTFSGNVKNFTNRKNPQQAYVQLVTIGLDPENTLNSFNSVSQQTDSLGRFFFNWIEYYDSAKVFIQSKKEAKDLNSRYFIEMDSIPVLKGRKIPKTIELDPDVTQLFTTISSEILDIERSYSSDVIILDELVIEDDPMKSIHEAIGGRYSTPSHRLMVDSVIAPLNTLSDVLRQMPSIFININGTLSMRGRSAVLFYDGSEVDSDYVADFIQLTPANDIFFVDVDLNGFSDFRGRQAIYVYSKSGNGVPMSPSNRIYKGEINFHYPGYARANDFVLPDYNPTKGKVAKPDKRIAIYWNPSVNIENGRANVNFYIGDLTGDYEIKVEGISKDGKVVLGKSTFSVK